MRSACGLAIVLVLTGFVDAKYFLGDMLSRGLNPASDLAATQFVQEHVALGRAAALTAETCDYSSPNYFALYGKQGENYGIRKVADAVVTKTTVEAIYFHRRTVPGDDFSVTMPGPFFPHGRPSKSYFLRQGATPKDSGYPYFFATPQDVVAGSAVNEETFTAALANRATVCGNFFADSCQALYDSSAPQELYLCLKMIDKMSGEWPADTDIDTLYRTQIKYWEVAKHLSAEKNIPGVSEWVDSFADSVEHATLNTAFNGQFGVDISDEQLRTVATGMAMKLIGALRVRATYKILEAAIIATEAVENCAVAPDLAERISYGASGSAGATSDIDINLRGKCNEKAVASFNALFRNHYKADAGLVFDVNAYVEDYMSNWMFTAEGKGPHIKLVTKHYLAADATADQKLVAQKASNFIQDMWALAKLRVYSDRKIWAFFTEPFTDIAFTKDDFASYGPLDLEEAFSLYGSPKDAAFFSLDPATYLDKAERNMLTRTAKTSLFLRRRNVFRYVHDVKFQGAESCYNKVFGTVALYLTRIWRCPETLKPTDIGVDENIMKRTSGVKKLLEVYDAAVPTGNSLRIWIARAWSVDPVTFAFVRNTVYEQVGVFTENARRVMTAEHSLAAFLTFEASVGALSMLASEAYATRAGTLAVVFSMQGGESETQYDTALLVHAFIDNGADIFKATYDAADPSSKAQQLRSGGPAFSEAMEVFHALSHSPKYLYRQGKLAELLDRRPFSSAAAELAAYTASAADYLTPKFAHNQRMFRETADTTLDATNSAGNLFLMNVDSAPFCDAIRNPVDAVLAYNGVGDESVAAFKPAQCYLQFPSTCAQQDKGITRTGPVEGMTGMWDLDCAFGDVWKKEVKWYAESAKTGDQIIAAVAKVDTAKNMLFNTRIAQTQKEMICARDLMYQLDAKVVQEVLKDPVKYDPAMLMEVLSRLQVPSCARFVEGSFGGIVQWHAHLLVAMRTIMIRGWSKVWQDFGCFDKLDPEETPTMDLNGCVPQLNADARLNFLGLATCTMVDPILASITAAMDAAIPPHTAALTCPTLENHLKYPWRGL